MMDRGKRMPSRVLIVDDESQITNALRLGLKAHQFDVRTARDGTEALDTFRDFGPDLVITDLQMPEMSGLELCVELRKISKVPIIVLSVRGEERTKVAALESGADDYVTKPFGMEELVARIRAILRRAPNDRLDNYIEVGDFVVDVERHLVRVRGAEVRLTPKEFDLLHHMIKHPGRVLTHRSILSAIWGPNYSEQIEYLRVFLGNLRKKIELDPARPEYIRTEPWVGYRFVPDHNESL